jgi:hypothetical protein
LFAALVAFAPSSTGLAQDYPTKSIRLVLGAAPGGSADAGARIVPPRLSQLLGQSVVIDNRPGANNNIATELVAHIIMSDTNVERLKLHPELKAERLAEIPAGRYGEPDEIADSILYLVASAPAYLQGHNLVVDGGYVSH